MIDKFITPAFFYIVSVVGVLLISYRIYRWKRLNDKNLFTCKWTLNWAKLFTLILFFLAFALKIRVVRKMLFIGYPFVNLNISMVALIFVALFGNFVDLILRNGITDSEVYSPTIRKNFDKLESFTWKPIKDERFVELLLWKKYKRYPDYVPEPVVRLTFEKDLQDEVERFLLVEKKLKCLVAK